MAPDEMTLGVVKGCNVIGEMLLVLEDPSHTIMGSTATYTGAYSCHIVTPHIVKKTWRPGKSTCTTPATRDKKGRFYITLSNYRRGTSVWSRIRGRTLDVAFHYALRCTVSVGLRMKPKN
ncbi:uncharacterized protein BCR38DRAFT_198034 [Pseudomassariella vexata]|uniref:Uncharacterized protein n=1 Tax=Pseudomassariella vexata TaxID=1141098 RepID=A0A1Y2E1R9_9PEZI|nr:uncharacterized protein BCR38DRAFT_198034 [Pseudomassariella vexata]ORY65472.1 hypothetical protein BCR38DRAFT_198034 [Pseudomassariella vexata]